MAFFIFGSTQTVKHLRLKILSDLKLKNLFIYGIGQAVNVVSPLIVVPFLVMQCGEANLGRIGIGFAFAMIAIVLVDGGSYINGTREIAVSSTDAQQLGRQFTTVYVAKMMLLAAVTLVSVGIIFAIPFFRRDWFQLCLSLSIVAGQAINPTWFFQGVQNFKWITAVNILSKVIYVGGVFWLVNEPSDYVYVNLLWGVGMVVSGFIGVFAIANRYGWRWTPRQIQESVVLVLREFPLTISQLFFSVYQYIPVVLVGFFGGDFMAGQYRIIEQIVMVFRTYLQTFFNFIYPQVCSSIYENEVRGTIQWRRVNLAGYALIVLMLVVFFWQSEAILHFFKVTENLQQMQHYFRIALILPLVMGFTFSLRQLVFAFNRERIYIQITIAATLFLVVFLALAASIYGLTAVFASLIAVELLIAIAYSVILADKLKPVSAR